MHFCLWWPVLTGDGSLQFRTPNPMAWLQESRQEEGQILSLLGAFFILLFHFQHFHFHKWGKILFHHSLEMKNN